MKFERVGPTESEKYDKLIAIMPAFVKIYSPNCIHCINMKEAWDSLDNNDDIKKYDIAIIEVHEQATNNIKSSSGKITEGLPTIRAVNLHGDKWKEYEGDRSVKDMIKFIKEYFKFNNKMMSGGKKKYKRNSKKQKRTKRTKRTKRKITKRKRI
jgi:hypothetical protein